jgi:hypothetical protein
VAGYELIASFKIIIIQTEVPMAANAVTHAAIARMVSSGLAAGAAAAGARCAGAGRAA